MDQRDYMRRLMALVVADVFFVLALVAAVVHDSRNTRVVVIALPIFFIAEFLYLRGLQRRRKSA